VGSSKATRKATMPSPVLMRCDRIIRDRFVDYLGGPRVRVNFVSAARVVPGDLLDRACRSVNRRPMIGGSGRVLTDDVVYRTGIAERRRSVRPSARPVRPGPCMPKVPVVGTDTRLGLCTFMCQAASKWAYALKCSIATFLSLYSGQAPAPPLG
jgi:hypothetical protein